MSDGAPPGGQLERWIGVAATIIAPATLLSAVLFYFGYVSSRSQYEYFGVDVDTIGLSTRDYVMRSPQPLLVPLLALALAAAALVAGHAAVRGALVGEQFDADRPARRRRPGAVPVPATTRRDQQADRQHGPLVPGSGMPARSCWARCRIGSVGSLARLRRSPRPIRKRIVRNRG